MLCKWATVRVWDKWMNSTKVSDTVPQLHPYYIMKELELDHRTHGVVLVCIYSAYTCAYIDRYC